jgi:hypothetical protein
MDGGGMNGFIDVIVDADMKWIWRNGLIFEIWIRVGLYSSAV